MDYSLRNKLQFEGRIDRGLANVLASRLSESDCQRIAVMTPAEVRHAIVEILAPGDRLPPLPAQPEIPAPTPPQPEVSIVPPPVDKLDLD